LNTHKSIFYLSLYSNFSCSTNLTNFLGYNRSKLEIYLEQELIKLYSTLEIHFCRSDTIGSELDIYIPSLKLAFEINGIFHYKPIFGEDKLKKNSRQGR
jgi:hypothetical protein